MWLLWKILFSIIFASSSSLLKDVRASIKDPYHPSLSLQSFTFPEKNSKSQFPIKKRSAVPLPYSDFIKEYNNPPVFAAEDNTSKKIL